MAFSSKTRRKGNTFFLGCSTQRPASYKNIFEPTNVLLKNDISRWGFGGEGLPIDGGFLVLMDKSLE